MALETSVRKLLKISRLLSWDDESSICRGKVPLHILLIYVFSEPTFQTAANADNDAKTQLLHLTPSFLEYYRLGLYLRKVSQEQILNNYIFNPDKDWF